MKNSTTLSLFSVFLCALVIAGGSWSMLFSTSSPDADSVLFQPVDFSSADGSFMEGEAESVPFSAPSATVGRSIAQGGSPVLEVVEPRSPFGVPAVSAIRRAAMKPKTETAEAGVQRGTVGSGRAQLLTEADGSESLIPVPEVSGGDGIREKGIREKGIRENASSEVRPALGTEPVSGDPGVHLVSGTEAAPVPGALGTAKIPGLDRPSRYGIDPTKPFDPVKENGEIFVGWKKPEVSLVLTGRLNGYMEPCGCAGLERMTGGLSRQASFIQQLKEEGWNPLVLDVGGLSPGVTKQAQMKFLATVNMLREMEYDAITLGTIDLAFPCADVLAEVANPGYAGQLFTSASVGLFEFDNKMLPLAKIVSRNGFKIGIIGILGEKEREQVQNDEIVYRAPRLALAKLVPQLKAQCQFIVLLSHASMEESKALAREFPDLDIIVTPDGPPVSPSVPEVLPETGQYVISIGEKGMNVIVLGLYDDDRKPLLYQRVPMDSRFPSSKKILDLMGLYQEQLKLQGLEGLGVRPARNPFMKTNGIYVGSKRCESCHKESYDVWKKSRHAMAWKSLEEATPPRTFDPECIACHVVGWSAEHRLPFQSGFLSMMETPQLKDVGCESCHGPGSLHMNAEIGSDTKLQARYRKALHLEARESKAICIQCHDLDNSPNFNFERYYPYIEHHEASSDDEDDTETEDGEE